MRLLCARAFSFSGIFLAAACSSDAPTDGGAAGSGNAPTAGSHSAGTGNAGGPVAMAGSNAGGASGAGTAGSASGGDSGGASGGASAGAGTAGSAGSGVAGGTHASGNSAGCMKPTSELPTAWNKHTINVTVAAKYAADYSSRTYFTRPPKNYDPSKAYPVTVWGQGCGQTVAEPTPLTGNPAGDNSIQIELLANPKNPGPCYSAGPDGDNVDSPEIPYFDAVLAEAESNFCIDKGKVYMGGWSSGGWLSSLITCVRADVVKGVGWASAGLQNNHPECVGAIPAIIERGTMDNGTPLDRTMAAIENIRVRNGCSTETEAWRPGETEFTTTTCVSYKGCKAGFPLVWCPINAGHNNGTVGNLSNKGFWTFWQSLP